MRAARPTSVSELVSLLSRKPNWRIISGGTDLMVEANFGRTRPEGLIDTRAIGELARISETEDGLFLGAGVTFAQLEHASDGRLAGLAVAARTVASPQVRSMATIGGNIGTASPAGDAHPILLAAGATVVLASENGRRRVPVGNYFLGPGRSVRRDDEAVVGIQLPLSSSTSQQFSKIGPRNAMVISVASVGLIIDWQRQAVGVGLGSVGPTPMSAEEAQGYLSSVLWSHETTDGETTALSAEQAAEFAELVASAASPIDDVRGTAAYRRHTVRTLARRTLVWALDDHRRRTS